jgi:hypothetical protein
MKNKIENKNTQKIDNQYFGLFSVISLLKINTI